MKNYNILKEEKQFNKVCGSDYKFIPSFIKPVRRIIGIGDIHGDLELTINFLFVGKLVEEIRESDFGSNSFKIPIYKDTKEFINSYNKLRYIILDKNTKEGIKEFRYFNWIGRDTYVVQVGDQIDRCRPIHDKGCKIDDATMDDENSDLLIMELFDVLNILAEQNGGAVYSLIGNHEVMNFNGLFDYVSHKGLYGYDRMEIFNKKRKKFACTRNTLIMIGDFIFVHAGIVTKLLDSYHLFNINTIVRNLLIEGYFSEDILYSNKISPLWVRQLGQLKSDDESGYDSQCDFQYTPVENYFKHYGINIKGLIIGHTPQFTIGNTGISTACNKKVIRIDIGASKAFNILLGDKYKEQRKPQVIEILNNEIINILN